MNVLPRPSHLVHVEEAGAQQHSWKLLNNEYQAPSVTITSFNHWKYTATNEHLIMALYLDIPITLFLCVFNVHIMTHSQIPLQKAGSLKEGGHVP